MCAVVVTIKARHLSNIISGKKSWELRKTLPANGEPFKAYCVQSASGGNIPCSFLCDGYKKLFIDSLDPEIVKAACVTEEEIRECAGGKPFIYAWHVSGLKKHETRGMNISDFGFVRPPQSWQYAADDVVFGEV